MSTQVVLADGRAWITSNGLFDIVIESIASVVDVSQRGPLGAWLLEQRCEVQGPGVGYLDVRELAPWARTEVARALPPALQRLDRSREMVAKSIHLLERMLAQPDVVDPRVQGGVMPPTRERKGPGWVDEG